MERHMRQRLVMTAMGGLAGLCLHLLLKVAEQQILPDRAALCATGFAAVFFGGWLSLTGPLPARRAAAGAALVAAAVTVFLLLASLRFDGIESMFSVAGSVLPVLILALVPLPFLVAADQGNWRDYPALFTAAWTLTVRMAAAWLFTALVWGLLLLSNALLELVGVDVIGRITDTDMGPWLVTGLALGLALAVVMEYSDLISPALVLKLLRILLPLVLCVVALFILGLPLRGLEAGFGTVSVAQILIAMAAAAALLVTIAIDQSDAEAVEGTFMRRATQALALLLPVPAAVAAWALWQRVAAYGWTPERLAGAVAAAFALAYGLLYAGSVLSGRAWMARIRAGNIGMALVLLVTAALWQTPLFDPTRIAARDQLARVLDGRTELPDLDPYAIGRWGRAGSEALEALQQRASEPGQEALADRLARPGVPGRMRASEDLAVELATLMAVRPPGKEAMREAVVARLAPAERRVWRDGCRIALPDGRPGCVMIVGDFLTERPGEEALVLLLRPRGGLSQQGFGLSEGRLDMLSVQDLTPATAEAPEAVIAGQLDAGPDLGPAPVNRLRAGGSAFVLMP
ncbi:DUF4153 domain-containing protein [Cereibacter johrii]|uniref:DUF4153 domain-containing protein n=1 Tax=Cereibacter johrii TaxID=445629 RepID=UPI002B25EA1C|nr:DUF4153 domain-containing protein [Cereibacter johrii]MEA5161196.1 DUF4153 domain-containing protein [Cereibacter johrii]